MIKIINILQYKIQNMNLEPGGTGHTSRWCLSHPTWRFRKYDSVFEFPRHSTNRNLVSKCESVLRVIGYNFLRSLASCF